MARIAFLLGKDFEDSEFRVPYDRLREAGHEPVVIGSKAGVEVKGKKGNETFKVEKAPGDVRAEDFDAVVIPGGYSPDSFRMDPAIVDFLKGAAGAGKPVAAVCHAGSLLIEADLVRGRRVTSWPSIRTDLINAGARWEDRSVVEDGNLITSRNPGDLEDFSAAILARVGETSRVG